MKNIDIDESLQLQDTDLASVAGGVNVENADIIATVQYWYNERGYGLAVGDYGENYFINLRLFDISSDTYHLSSGEKVKLKILNDKPVKLFKLS